MSVKQDRTAVRTATDLERKYQFGKTFAEMLGLINESRDKVDSVESSLENEIEERTTLSRTASEVSVKVEQIMTNGTTRVETETGFVLDADGLNISKSGEEMTNLLDNTGMYVKKNDKEILTANNEGVKATDLHANTYLIIGSGDGRSRFEDYGTNRTACFWVGG